MPAHRPWRLVFLGPWLVALSLALLLSGCAGLGKSGDEGAAKDPVTGKSTAKPEKSKPAPDPAFGAVKAGQCYLIFAAQSKASVASGRKVGCAARHTTVVAYVGFLRRPITPKTSIAQRRKLGKRFCEPAYRRVAGGTVADRATSILTWTLFTPDQAQLERGARWMRCDVLARGGPKLIPLPQAMPLLAQGVPEQLRVCQDEQGVDISCSNTHAYRVDAVYQAAGDAYPNTASYTVLARTRCKELTGKDGGFWQPPSQAAWRSGDRFIRCLTGSS